MMKISNDILFLSGHEQGRCQHIRVPGAARAVVTCEISLTNSFYICLSENRSQIPLLIPFVPSTDASIINSYWEKSCALNADS